MIKDEEVKTEFKLNDFDVITGLFEVLEESDENLTYLLLETIFLFARVRGIFCVNLMFCLDKPRTYW